MSRGYIYLISFNNTNDIYIGKTKVSIAKRLKQHKKDNDSSVNLYVRNRFNGDWSNVYIDIIDSIDMNEDLTHLKTREELKHYQLHNLNNLKLSTLEMFHIHNYISEGKYKIINNHIQMKKINDDLYNVFFKV